MNVDFPAFALSDEHEALRASVRALADDKIAPRAADIDQTSEFPWDVFEALAKADLAAVHIPEEYGGAGADAIATAIVIEEVARACAASSLIPAVNKLGTVPLLLAGSEDIKQKYLPPVARGEAMFSYALSEPEAGSDAAAMKCRAVRDGGTYVLNGTKRWITNAGVSTYYTVMAVTDPAAGSRGISAFVVEKDDPGFTFGAPERKLGIKGSPTRELYFDNCVIPADRLIGEEGTGFKTALTALGHTRVTIAAQALGIAQALWVLEVDRLGPFLVEGDAAGKSLLTKNLQPAWASDLGADSATVTLFGANQTPPLGYYATFGDAARLDAALAELPQMVGEFEKPKFFKKSMRLLVFSSVQTIAPPSNVLNTCVA